MFPVLSPEETQAQLRAIFGDAREKRSPVGCDHCMHAPNGLPTYAPGADVPNPACCYCGIHEDDIDRSSAQLGGSHGC